MLYFCVVTHSYLQWSSWSNGSVRNKGDDWASVTVIVLALPQSLHLSSHMETTQRPKS